MTATTSQVAAPRRREPCAGCGHDLAGVPAGAVCPECGIAIPPASETAAPLGRAAASGALLMSGQSLLTRALTLGAQIVLARLLTPNQFGQYGIAMAVLNYANLAQQVGVREVLIARQRRFRLWENAAFWIAMTAGVLSAIAIAGAAPLVAWFYRDQTLLWMLLIFAVAQPLYNLTVVQEARLQVDMRFRYLSLGQFVQGALTPFSQVSLVLCHLGSYALILPRLIVGLARWAFFRRAAQITVRRDPQLRLWRYMIIPGTMVLTTNLAYNIGPTVPVLVLGRMGEPGSTFGKDAVGYFNFALNLSLQAMMLLSIQIDSILFPTLGKLAAEPERQHSAFLRAGHALSAVMAPICLVQIIAARPLLLLVFGPKWESAVLPFQIMSVGMFSAGSFAPAHSLLQAQGRFAAKLWLALLWGVLGTAIGVAGILLAPQSRAVDAAALGLAISYVGYSVHYCIAASAPLGGGLRDVFRIITMPTLVGAIAGGLAIGANMLAAGARAATAATVSPSLGTLLRGRLSPERATVAVDFMLEGIILGGVACITYAALLRLLAPGVWKDLMQTGQPIVNRLRRLLPKRGAAGKA